jgi:hypothetical protein
VVRSSDVSSVLRTATAILLSAATIGSIGVAAPAAASGGEEALNGVFTATSNGEWAKLNDRYQGHQTVKSTWTISSTCLHPLACAGTVRSSLGWTENISKTETNWVVRHYVPDFIPCPDGTQAPGLQYFRFYPANVDGMQQSKSDYLLGEDQTTGESGACGRNLSLLLNLPFKLLKEGSEPPVTMGGGGSPGAPGGAAGSTGAGI